MPSMDALVGFAADAKKSGKGMRGDVLYISGMPLVYWSKTDELNARFSSGAYADVPVFLSGMDGHTGDSNGFAVDAGLDKIEAVIPPPTKERYLEGGRAAIHYLHSLGITAWLDAAADPSILSAYRSLSQRGA